MSRLDYSKWDHIECSSDEEDEERTDHTPHVTRLEDGVSVQIGPDGASIMNKQTPLPSSISPESSHASNEPGAPSSILSAMNVSAGSKYEGTIYKTSHNPEDGGFPITYKWQQTREEIYLWVPIANSLKASALQVEYFDATNSLRVSSNGIDIISGQLKYKINFASDESLDWEITNVPQMQSGESTSSSQRCIQIVFQKHVYTPGSVVWWSAVFSNDDTIDVTQIPERLRSQRSNNSMDSNAGRECTTQSFAEAWKQAHDIFTEKVDRKRLHASDYNENELDQSFPDGSSNDL